MYYFDMSGVEEIVITFENFQSLTIESCFIQAIGIERTKWPNNSNEETVFPTKIMLDKEVYRSPDVLDRLRQYRDITWIDVVFKDNKATCTWPVPWVDDPDCEDENILQRKLIELPSEIVIYIDDYRY